MIVVQDNFEGPPLGWTAWTPNTFSSDMAVNLPDCHPLPSHCSACGKAFESGDVVVAEAIGGAAPIMQHAQCRRQGSAAE